MDITDVESKMQAEIDEWRTDRNQLHNALEKERELTFREYLIF